MHPNKISSISDLEKVFIEYRDTLSWGCDKKFLKSVKKSDNSKRIKLLKQMEKALNDPYIGKHMSANRKGELELYVTQSSRLYYYYYEKDNYVFFSEFSHKDNQ